MTPARKKEIVLLLAERVAVETSIVSTSASARVTAALKDAMEALDRSENQLAEFARCVQQLSEQLTTLKSDHLKLMNELSELQLMSVREGTVRMGPTASEEAATKKPRGRRWRR